MSRWPHPPAPPFREPEPPVSVVNDHALVTLYTEAKALLRAGQYAGALKLYERLAGLVPSDARVPHLLGLLHWWGAGTPRDPVQAERWLERAARSGDNYAYLSLSKVCRETGRPDEGRRWLEEAADKDYTPAVFFLGHGWEFGYWGTVDRVRAFEYYERAAAEGYCRAGWREGALLLRGRRGIWRIPMGLFKYVTAPLRMCGLLWRDPYDERVIW